MLGNGVKHVISYGVLIIVKECYLFCWIALLYIVYVLYDSITYIRLKSHVMQMFVLIRITLGNMFKEYISYRLFGFEWPFMSFMLLYNKETHLPRILYNLRVNETMMLYIYSVYIQITFRVNTSCLDGHYNSYKTCNFRLGSV